MAAAITKKQALKALDGMATIVDNEMLTRGSYVSQTFNPAMAGSVCGGRKYCAIGSLWAGAGIRPERSPGSVVVIMPGAFEESREDFMRSRHGLRLAYRSLNAAADEFIDAKGIERPDAERESDWRYVYEGPLNLGFKAPIESLFEGDGVGRPELLEIIDAARVKVLAA